MVEQLRTRASVIVGVLVLLGSSAEAVAAPPPPPPPDAVTLEYEMSVLDADLATRIQRQLEAEIESSRGDGTWSFDGTPGSIQRRLQIRVVAFDEDRRDYEVQIDASAGGETETVSVIRCEACNERRLVEVVVENLEPLVVAPTQKIAAVPLPVERSSPADEPSEVPVRRPRALTGMGVAGAVMLGVGVSASAAGGYMLVREPDRRPALASARTKVVDVRPWGAASVGVGVLVTSVGAALLATDLRGRRDGRSRVTPLLSPTFVGLQYHRRF
jgi:hypothetical protein